MNSRILIKQKNVQKTSLDLLKEILRKHYRVTQSYKKYVISNKHLITKKRDQQIRTSITTIKNTLSISLLLINQLPRSKLQNKVTFKLNCSYDDHEEFVSFLLSQTINVFITKGASPFTTNIPHHKCSHLHIQYNNLHLIRIIIVPLTFRSNHLLCNH